MNKAEFHIVAEHPENLSKAHLSELKNILSDFPWFQAGQAMLLRTLHNLNHYDFDKQLHHTAILVPDREVLFQYIYDIKHPSDLAAPSAVDQLLTTPSPEPVAPIANDSANFADQVEKHISNALESDTAATAPIVPVENRETIPTDEQPPHLQVLATEHTETEATSDKPVTDPISISAVPVNEKHSFSEWLQLLKSSQQEVSATEAATQSIAADEKLPAETTEEKPAPETRSNIAEFESILDKFIRENPRISRPKIEFYNPVNMARQSIQEDEELVTETLAQLYYRQKAYKKAIRAYEKLSLIYPHRIAYFADLIQKIKTEIKD